MQRFAIVLRRRSVTRVPPGSSPVCQWQRENMSVVLLAVWVGTASGGATPSVRGHPRGVGLAGAAGRGWLAVGGGGWRRVATAAAAGGDGGGGGGRWQAVAVPELAPTPCPPCHTPHRTNPSPQERQCFAPYKIVLTVGRGHHEPLKRRRRPALVAAARLAQKHEVPRERVGQNRRAGVCSSKGAGARGSVRDSVP